MLKILWEMNVLVDVYPFPSWIRLVNLFSFKFYYWKRDNWFLLRVEIAIHYVLTNIFPFGSSLALNFHCFWNKYLTLAIFFAVDKHFKEIQFIFFCEKSLIKELYLLKVWFLHNSKSWPFSKSTILKLVFFRNLATI